MEPFVSVVILNYNGKKVLGTSLFSQFLASVLETNYSNFEVLFIDNCSTDDSVSFVRSKFSCSQKLRVIVNPKNLGFSAGNNVALNYAHGEYLALLNNDVEVDPNWLTELVKVMQLAPSIGLAQSKIFSLDRVHIQSVGNIMDLSMMTFLMGDGETDKSQYNKICEITYGCGASFIVRRSLVEKIGLFDSNYFFYHDDCDLGWRVRLSGFKIVLAPLSIVYHKGHVTSTATFRKNRYWFLNSCSRFGLYIKNLEYKNLLKIAPYICISLGLDFFGLILKGDVTTLKDFIAWIIKNFKSSWECRLVVQTQIRQVGDKEVLKYFLGSYSLLLRIMRYPSRLVGGLIDENYTKLVKQSLDDYYSKHLLKVF